MFELIWQDASRQRQIDDVGYAEVGSMTDRHCLRSDVGIGLRSQCLSEEERRTFATSSSELFLNCKSVTGAEGGEWK